ncbi:hypothetical protein C8024_13080 [Sphingopyxis sp. BSNA05]|nr:hypothetical protein [Sphingopyxis sp. BSNA05]
MLAYPLVAAVVWAAAGMDAAFAFSAGLLAYVYAMIHLGTAKGWNRKFFCDMKSKRSPEMVGFLRVIGRLLGGYEAITDPNNPSQFRLKLVFIKKATVKSSSLLFGLLASLVYPSFIPGNTGDFEPTL